MLQGALKDAALSMAPILSVRLLRLGVGPALVLFPARSPVGSWRSSRAVGLLASPRAWSTPRPTDLGHTGSVTSIPGKEYFPSLLNTGALKSCSVLSSVARVACLLPG